MDITVVDSFLAKADPDQRRAITHPLGGGPAIVVAGAGAGKTRVLTGRVAWLMAQGVPGRKIVAVTFTNKAADELRERIGVTEGAADCPRVSTIHALALGAIRKDPTGFSLSSRVSPLDTMDQADMIDTLVQAKLSGAKRDSAWAEFNKWGFLEKVGYHRARGLGFASDYSPEVHAEALKYQKGRMALSPDELNLWKEYEEQKRNSSSVDFDDMLHLVVRRGLTDEAWADRLGSIFLHVLVDESQDTSPIQWAFLELLVGNHKNDIFAVGDVNQSIFSFQGASPDILVAMAKSWRGVVPALYNLGRNYRSVPGIVRLANRIQGCMTTTLPLVMSSQREEQAEVRGTAFLQSASPRDIAGNIAERIAQNNRPKGSTLRYRDHAVLVRSKGQIKDVEMELIRCRVPYVIRGGQGVFQSREAKDLVSYLRIVSNPRDVVAFTRAASVPKRGIGDAGVRALQLQAAKGHEGDLVAAAQASPNPKLNEFGCQLRLLQRLVSQDGAGVVELLNRLIELIGFRSLVIARYRADGAELETKLTALDKILEAIGAIEESLGGGSLEDVVFRLTMDKEEEVKDEDGGGKTVISTIHSAKGLEWPVVFVTNVVEGSLPHSLCRTPSEIEEERRLWYVACTRAQDRLYICVPNSVHYGPKMVPASPSRFIEELRARRA